MTPPTKNRPVAWQLQLYGDFSLRDPAGRLVRLPDRKVEGLLAVLAVHRDYGIDRADVADILWPSRAPANLGNLRQALSVLRRTFGEGAIEASRRHCRLSSELHIESDYEQEPNRRGGFMPGHSGDWFDVLREEDGDAAAPPRSVVSSFFEMLQWFAIHDRRGMHSLLKAKASLTRGLLYTDLLQLLRAAPDDEASAGWSSYWQGTAENDLEKCAELLRTSLREAKRSGDLTLASHACLELGKVYSRTGRLDKALRICDIADSVAARSGKQTQKANAMRLRGTVLVHWQDQAEGLAMLRRTEEFIDDPIDHAVLKSSRAFFEASAHQLDQASRTVDEAMRLSRQMGHLRFDLTSSLTQVLLKIANGPRDRAIAELTPLVQRYYSLGATQFGVYAEELLAKLLCLEGERATAKRHLVSARHSRTGAQMVVTRLEALRVAQVG